MSYEENKISDLIDKGLHEQEQLFLSDVRLSLPDIRNKLSPFKNLIAMLEGCKVEHSDERINMMIKHEIQNCKKSIAYLSGNKA